MAAKLNWPNLLVVMSLLLSACHKQIVQTEPLPDYSERAVASCFAELNKQDRDGYSAAIGIGNTLINLNPDILSINRQRIELCRAYAFYLRDGGKLQQATLQGLRIAKQINSTITDPDKFKRSFLELWRSIQL